MIKKEVLRWLCWQKAIFIKGQEQDPWVENVAFWGRDWMLTLQDGTGREVLQECFRRPKDTLDTGGFALVK